MRKRGGSLTVSADGAPALGASGPHSEHGVLDLAPELLSRIVVEAVRLGAGNALSRTCRAFSASNLLHASIFSVHLNRARCNQLLTPRVLAALRARSSKLAIALEWPDAKDSDTEMLAPAVLAKIGRCEAVTAVELCSDTAGSDALRQALDGSPRFAQCLLDSFPGLTALTLRDLSVTCSGLASMLSHSGVTSNVTSMMESMGCICMRGQLPFDHPE
ncbi:hypothetical protein QJQ45_001431 [Haematococcus lacustris]|nr:hypothetical protein QJQ45_001431 [Haematococcus lacustris]